MSDVRKFVYYPMQKAEVLQPECPVYVYGYGLAKQKRGNAAFVQVRLVNRTDKQVNSVFLRICGRDQQGNSLYELQYVPLVDCVGEAYKDFGEEQPLFLPQGDVSKLEIHVMDVLFEDGMVWRIQNSHRLMTAEEAGWVTCSCGMKNPAEAVRCVFCGKGAPKTEGEEESVFVYEPIASIADLPEKAAETEAPVEEIEEAEVSVEETEKIEIPVEETEEIEIPVEETEEAEETEPSVEEPEEAQEPEETPEEEEVPVYAEEPEEELLSEEEIPETEEEADRIIPEEDPNPTEEELEELTDEELEALSSDCEYMQETEQLLHEIRQRLRAIESGEPLPTEKAVEEEIAQEPEAQLKNRSRGVLFWILMVILLIVLGGAAFLAVLYWKGYFG